MRVGILGGTGKLGAGLAVRWAKAGHEVLLGSRDGERARARAAELGAMYHVPLAGGGNDWAAGEAEVAVLTVPYDAHAATLGALRGPLRGKVLVDATVPLQPPKVARVHLPPGLAAALEAQALLGADTPVAAAFHHLSAAHLADPEHRIDSDVLVAADDARARTAALTLARSLGLRALDAGALANAVALESLTPVLIHLNRTYKASGAGLTLTNVPHREGE